MGTYSIFESLKSVQRRYRSPFPFRLYGINLDDFDSILMDEAAAETF